MGITDILCQAQQQKSQDILNAMHLVSSIRVLIQKLRKDGWHDFFENVLSFSNNHIIIEHHYHFNILNATINFQLRELDSSSNEQTMEVLILSSTLDPKDGYKSFNIDRICSLVEKYYPLNFAQNEKTNLIFQLKHFEVDVPQNLKLQKFIFHFRIV
ncbi:hypothetical protein P3X46_000459 [Hevea brasiliensis]|uniref:DUF4371 domain-containing protein n=1 Tax=Hevea brasiliensis TaxID=3981 RepID=A0ABQ9NCG3_HEVBR|nr:hypothetical protein P3X46_000459 [Hevea brasiliensis]